MPMRAESAPRNVWYRGATTLRRETVTTPLPLPTQHVLALAWYKATRFENIAGTTLPKKIKSELSWPKRNEMSAFTITVTTLLSIF